MRKTILGAAVAAAFLSPAGVTTAYAQAAAPASPHTFTGNVAVVSDYRFRLIIATLYKDIGLNKFYQFIRSWLIE